MRCVRNPRFRPDPGTRPGYEPTVSALKEFQARHVIEFSGARNIYLDRLSRKLHTTWYVTGYN